jgi:hypothetical protein
VKIALLVFSRLASAREVSAGGESLSHEACNGGQALDVRRLFGPEHDFLTSFFDQNLVAIETKFLREPHCLAAAVFEKFCRSHIYNV